MGIAQHVGQVVGASQVAVQECHGRGIRELLEVGKRHPFGRLGVPVVRLLALAQLAVAPPQLLAADGGEDLDVEPVAQLHQLGAALEPLVQFQRPAAETLRQQGSADRRGVIELACRGHGLAHHRAPCSGSSVSARCEPSRASILIRQVASLGGSQPSAVSASDRKTGSGTDVVGLAPGSGVIEQRARARASGFRLLWAARAAACSIVRPSGSPIRTSDEPKRIDASRRTSSRSSLRRSSDPRARRWCSAASL